MPQPKPSTSSSAKSPDTSYRETLASVRLPINALVNALSNTSVAPRPTSNPKLPTSQAYHDLVALSKFCSAHITALGVALKPKADYVAAQAMLDKWLTELRKMELLVGVWVLQCRNEIWDKEVRWAALALAESYHVSLDCIPSAQLISLLTPLVFITELICNTRISHNHPTVPSLSNRPSLGCLVQSGRRLLAKRAGCIQQSPSRHARNY